MSDPSKPPERVLRKKDGTAVAAKWCPKCDFFFLYRPGDPKLVANYNRHVKKCKGPPC